MSLDPDGLKSDLETLFSAPPGSYAECGQAWADAVESYASGVVPASTTVTAAAATLATALTSAFSSGSAPALMETAFAAFATTVASGMAPAFTAVPPPSPVGFVAQFAGANPETHAAAANAIGGLIDTWMKTGTATPSGGGSPVTWS